LDAQNQKWRDFVASGGLETSSFYTFFQFAVVVQHFFMPEA